jgi:hypothetical protein
LNYDRLFDFPSTPRGFRFLPSSSAPKAFPLEDRRDTSLQQSLEFYTGFFTPVNSTLFIFFRPRRPRFAFASPSSAEPTTIAREISAHQEVDALFYGRKESGPAVAIVVMREHDCSSPRSRLHRSDVCASMRPRLMQAARSFVRVTRLLSPLTISIMQYQDMARSDLPRRESSIQQLRLQPLELTSSALPCAEPDSQHIRNRRGPTDRPLSLANCGPLTLKLLRLCRLI